MTRKHALVQVYNRPTLSKGMISLLCTNGSRQQLNR